MTPYTRLLAAAARTVELDAVPTAVLEHLKLAVLDTLGCGLLGSTLPWLAPVRDVALAEAAQGGAGVWGTAARTSPSAAALVNGTAVHSFELDDLHPASILHPGSVALSTALALGEELAVDGRTLTAAVLAGYELGARVGMAVGTAHLTDGWHPTGTNGVFASAAAAGRILRLDEQHMLHALAISGSQAAGILATQQGAMAKRFHAGRAAQSGVYSALLAQRGFTGAEDILEAEYGGYCSTYSSRPDLTKLSVGLDRDGRIQEYEMLNVGFKPYACGGSNHTSIELVQRLMREHRVAAGDIERVDVRTTTATYLHGGWQYSPSGVTAAQMNLPYCVAVMALDGDVGVDQFKPERLSDPEVLSLIARTHIAADSELDGLGSGYRHAVKVRISLRDGRQLTGELHHARGSARRPLSADEVVSKYRKLASGVLPQRQVDEVQELVFRLDELEDVSQLGKALESRSAD